MRRIKLVYRYNVNKESDGYFVIISKQLGIGRVSICGKKEIAKTREKEKEGILRRKFKQQQQKQKQKRGT